jgi:glycine C-acetyltransferase
MDGEQGILKEIVATKKKYDFRLLIDDAHGFGYMGPTGAGAMRHRVARMEWICISARL